MLSRWAQHKWDGDVCERQSVTEQFWEAQRWLSSDPLWESSSLLDERLSPYCHCDERTFIERRVVSRLLMTMLWQGLIRYIASLDSAVTSLLVLQLGRSSVGVNKKSKWMTRSSRVKETVQTQRRRQNEWTEIWRYDAASCCILYRVNGTQYSH